MVYESSRYTVVHARIPQDGRSRHQTWCHDYTELCYSLNKTRPTGCGRSSNHITEMHQCQTIYDSVMPHNNTLACPPNEKVSFIAKMAGFSTANSMNSFAFSNCGSSKCTDTLPDSGCHGALYCINQGNRDVFTLCTDPESNFVVEDKGYTTQKGVNYLALYVKPLNTSSRHENWCRDYQRLCESYGKRPTGCGIAYSGVTSYSSCRDEYLSIMPVTNELGCGNNMDKVASIAQNAGMPSTTESFNFHICGSSCNKDFPVCWALKCLQYTHYTYHALCTEPLTSFTVLEERWTVFNKINFLVIKARLPRDRKSTQEDWCRDYTKLCESYGQRATGSDIIQDHEYTSCRDKYGSVMIDGVFFESTPQSRIASIAQQAGFASANTDNSFGLDKCTRCPTVLTISNCEGLGCIKPSRHDDVYTVCVKPQSKFDVLERKTTTYNKKAYLVMKAKVMGGDVSNWAEEYSKTCSHYGRRNLACKNTQNTAPETTTYMSMSSTVQYTQYNSPETTTYAPTRTTVEYTQSKSPGTTTYAPTSTTVEYSQSNSPDTTTYAPTYSTVQYYQSNSPDTTTYAPTSSTVEYSQSNSPETTTYAPTSSTVEYSQSNSPETTAYAPTSSTVEYSQSNSPETTIYAPTSSTVEYSQSNSPETTAYAPTRTIVEYSQSNSPETTTYAPTSSTVKYSQSNSPETTPYAPTNSTVEYSQSNSPETTAYAPTNSAVEYSQSSSPETTTYAPTSSTVEYSQSNSTETTTYILTNSTVKYFQSNSPETTPYAPTNSTVEYSQSNSPETTTYAPTSSAVEYSQSNSPETTAYAPTRTIVEYSQSNSPETTTYAPTSSTVKYSQSNSPETTPYAPTNSTVEYSQSNSPETTAYAPTNSAVEYSQSSSPETTTYAPTSSTVEYSQSNSTETTTYILTNSTVKYFQSNSPETTPYAPTNSTVEYSQSNSPETTTYAPTSSAVEYSQSNSPKTTTYAPTRGTVEYSQSNSPETTTYAPTNSTVKYSQSNSPGTTTYAPTRGTVEYSQSNSPETTAYAPTRGTVEYSQSNSPETTTYAPTNSTVEYSQSNSPETTAYAPTSSAVEYSQSNSPETTTYAPTRGTVEYSQSNSPETATYAPTNSTVKYSQSNSPGTTTYAPTRGTVEYSQSNSPETTAYAPTNTIVEYSQFNSSETTTYAPTNSTVEYSQSNSPETTAYAPTSSAVEYSQSNSPETTTYAPTRGTVEYSQSNSPETATYAPTNSTVKYSQSNSPGTITYAPTRGTVEYSQSNSPETTAYAPTNTIVEYSQFNSSETTTYAPTRGTVEYSQSNSPETTTYAPTNSTVEYSQSNSPETTTYAPTRGTVEYSQSNSPETTTYAPTNITVEYSQSNSPGTTTYAPTSSTVKYSQSNSPGTTTNAFFSSTPTGKVAIELMQDEITCNQADVLQTVALNAGFGNATTSNIYIPDSFKANFTPSTEVVYLLCEGSDSNFEVVSTKPAAVRGQEYLIIEATLPQNGLARHKTWCEDYKELCLSYGQRPVGCGKESGGSSHSACRDTYDAILPRDNAIGCPSNLGVISLANQTGYLNASVNNSFAFSICNKSTCTKDHSNAMALYAQMTTPSIGRNQSLYTLCVGSNTSFIVESSKNVSYQGGAYKIIKARISPNHISKQQTWCHDYQSLCNSYGWRPLMTSHDADVGCERNHGAISPTRDEVSSTEKLEYLVKTAGYDNANVGNIFAFREKCNDSCFADISDFSSATEPAMNLSKNVVSQNNDVVFAVCINSDTNFHVLDSSRINYQNRSYLVLKTRIPSHGVSKYENWCADYQRLCDEYEMRPVSILSRESNAESRNSHVGSCIPDYKSIVVPKDKNLTLFTREQISIMANSAGYREASRDNSFAFSECNPKSCPRFLDSKCASGLDCLWNEPRQLYTVCTDSNSNFIAKQTRHIKHKGVPYLLIRSSISENGISRHQNWCLDYKNICNSFGMQPVVCENPQKVSISSSSNCSTDFANTSNSCELKNIDVLRKLVDESFLRNSSVFMPARCDNCNETMWKPCQSNSNCPDKVKTTLTFCTALQSNFKVLETRQIEHQNVRLTIVKTKVISNDTSFHKNWGYDYNKMCLSLGKRPFSCREPGNIIQYKNQEEYNIFLSEGCSDILKLKLLPIQAGFSQVKNVMLFEGSLIPTEELVSRNLSKEFAESIPKKCCKCLNSSGNANPTSVPEKTLVTLIHKNTSFARTWKACVERGLGAQTLTQNCGMARDCFNNTRLANNTCEVISNCYHNNCTECCPCHIHQLHMSGCPAGKKCSSFNFSEEVYAFCSDFSASNFEMEDAREVMYADQSYTVVKAQIPSHGQSRSETWCEDYKMLCQAIGKRPLGCGKDFEILKQSRDCRIRYDAIMMEGMSCPGSEEFAAVARHAGFPANVNESLGLWNCEMCSKNFSENWNRTYSPNGTNVTHYITNISFDVYLLCTGSNSNFKVLEKRAVHHRGSPVSVVMTTIPHHGESLHENWCVDYSRLCQSYGLRPIGCGKSADNIEEHAQCRDGYNALMYSDDTIDCLEKFNVHEIAQSAGFTTATPQNSFIFKSCLAQHCTKFLPSAEHPFTPFMVNSTDRVFYTLCASSDSAYDVIATKPVTIAEQDYLVIRAAIPVEGQSKHINWCEDYKRLCEGYAMQPLTCKHSSGEQRKCIYNFGSISKTNTDLACPAKTGVASIAKQAGFDHVNDTNSFAMDLCGVSESCVAKMPNIKCVDITHYDYWFETNATQVEFTRADYIVNTTKTILNALNETETIIIPEAQHCLTVPSPPSGEPSYKIDGEKLTDIFKSNTCKWNFDLNGPGVSLFFFNVTVNQTFVHEIPRVETNCFFPSSNSLARMSGEANTVCIRSSSDTSFRVQSTRKTTNSGREYLIIQAKLLSAVSKSINWCMEYANLCKAFQSSPLACPRKYGFDTDYVKCLSSYGAIMMSDVDYACPSNGFVSQLARMTGYRRASLSNSFSLSNCNDAKCTSRLPLTGCSDAVHCLSHEVLHDHVYTACVVSNSDSNFNVIEKLEKQLHDYDYTMIRARLPVDGAPLFETWCEDYQRLCQSFNLRPLYCTGGGLSASDYGVCKQKYSSVLSRKYNCPTQVYRMARTAGFVGPLSKNSFAFHRCTMCSKNFHTSNCDKALNCLTTNVQLREVYTVCGGTETESSFQPLATKLVRHGRLRLRVVQAKVISQSSADSDWGKDYKNLCGFYNELPTGCGVVPGESSPGVSACESKYSSYVLHGDELGCNPNDVIAKLARNAGFVNARPSNSFGFSHCNGSSVSQLSSTCHRSLPCLTWTPENPIVYTVCVNKLIGSNFEVLGAKSITFDRMDYLVIHAQIPEDGKSYKANWCQDYKELCVSYDMLPQVAEEITRSTQIILLVVHNTARICQPMIFLDVAMLKSSAVLQKRRDLRMLSRRTVLSFMIAMIVRRS